MDSQQDILFGKLDTHEKIVAAGGRPLMVMNPKYAFFEIDDPRKYDKLTAMYLVFTQARFAFLEDANGWVVLYILEPEGPNGDTTDMDKSLMFAAATTSRIILAYQGKFGVELSAEEIEMEFPD